ncbi:MAG: hypothetical protein Q4G59_09720 [Planctomycetia bacterium]|nr:hypothetical protein [Planctomycetia bacterium]
MTAKTSLKPTFWLGIILLFAGGCSVVPDSSPRWCGGMGEYSTKNSDLRNDWENAVSDSSSPVRQQNQAQYTRPNKEKPSFFQQLFGFRSSASGYDEQKHGHYALYDENHFYPVDDYMDLYRFRLEQARQSHAALQEVTLDEPATAFSHADSHSKISRQGVSKPPVPGDATASPEIDSLISTLETQQALPLSSVTAKQHAIPTASLPVALIPEKQNKSGLSAGLDSGTIRQVQHIDTIVKPVQGEAVPATAKQQTNWKEQTETAIALLEKELAAKKLAGTLTPEEQMRLKLLYLTVNKQAKEEMPRGKVAPVELFWQEQYRGLSVMLGGNTLGGKSDMTLNQATEHFQRGLDSLRQECPLQVRKALFVQNAAPFGLYQPRQTPFAPGEVVYLYTELENVVSCHTSGGEEIVIDCAWELIDEKGKTIVPVQKETCTSLSESLLRDIVLNISVTLPTDIAKGNYTLELTLIDRHASRATTLHHRVDLSIP